MVGIAPIVVVQNFIGANFQYKGSGMAFNGRYESGTPLKGLAAPSANLTLRTNPEVNP